MRNKPLHLSTSTTFYQNTDFGGETANGINPLLFATYPSLAYDSWVTIGIAIRSLILLQEKPLTVQDAGASHWFTDSIGRGDGEFQYV